MPEELQRSRPIERRGGAVAVVVTHNRPRLLRACLEALAQQSGRLAGVIVVDNASTDGTPQMVRRDHPEVDLHVLPVNAGGAGGFAYGLDAALAQGYDHAWLMDDDAAPAPGSIGPLLDAMAHASQPSFVAASVVTSTGDSPWDHQPQPVRRDRFADRPRLPDAVRVDHASFVGVLVRLSLVERIGLPVADFFIWYDDFEFTRRLSGHGPGWAVRSAEIVHPDKQARADVGDRIFFVMRNSIWVARLLEPRTPFERTIWVLRAVKRSADQLIGGERRGRTARLVLKGALEGVVRRPVVPAVGAVAGTAGTAAAAP